MATEGRSARRWRGRREAARRDSRGAALVEGAIITPLLLLLVFGTIEFGFIFKDSLTLANASRAGARVESSAGNDPLADYNMLKAVQSAGQLVHVQRIVVFKASGPNGTMPPACATHGVAGVCNYFDGSDLTIDQATFQSAGYTRDDDWPSSSRQTSLSMPGGPDYVGVCLEAQHNAITISIFNKTLDDCTVMRLEPSR